MQQLRYWIFNEDNELIRKLFSRIECEPYLQSGCTLFVAPKEKQPTPTDKISMAYALVGDCLV